MDRQRSFTSFGRQRTPTEVRSLMGLARVGMHMLDEAITRWNQLAGWLRQLDSFRQRMEQLFRHYDKLDEDIRAELPLKRIWTIASESEE